ncbi:MAG: hypothetical protein P4L45_16485, partial [Ignavibacteriaceae bacterium]|nr:hypothetical protein [Ignavibacteriaceae bacterium]
MPEQITELLLERFVRSAEEAAATVEKVSRNADSLNEALLAATIKDELVLLSQPDDLDPELFSKFRFCSKVITNPTKEQLKTIRTGITDAFCAVASTG